MDGELGKDGKRGRDKELAHIATQHDEVQEIRAPCIQRILEHHEPMVSQRRG